MRQGLEYQLLKNQLPYPSNYDGHKWHTISSFKRKSLPSYLRKELPTARFSGIKQKFRQMDRIAPPEISFFQKMIKPPQRPKTQRKTIYSHKKKNQQKILQQSLGQMREEMQYALVMADHSSNLLVNLLQKVSKTEEDLSMSRGRMQPCFGKKLVKSKASQSVNLGKTVGMCFGNTTDLVFKMKKKQCEERMSAKTMVVIPSQRVQERVKSIRLRTYSAHSESR